MSTIYTGSRDQKRRSNPRSRKGDIVWNILTILIIVMILCVLLTIALLFLNPSVSFNPFPQPTLPAPLILPTVTSTLIKLPPTWTPESTRTVNPTNTQTPISSSIIQTETQSSPTEIPTVNDIQTTPVYPFALQSEPSSISAEVLYPDRACQWMGVGGQVLDLQGRPLTGMTIQVGGVLGQGSVNQTSLTGLALKYGEAGYEFELAKMPTASNQTLWIRMIDQANLPLSPRVYFDTTISCDKNLVIINFKQVRE